MRRAWRLWKRLARGRKIPKPPGFALVLRRHSCDSKSHSAIAATGAVGAPDANDVYRTDGLRRAESAFDERTDLRDHVGIAEEEVDLPALFPLALPTHAARLGGEHACDRRVPGIEIAVDHGVHGAR